MSAVSITGLVAAPSVAARGIRAVGWLAIAAALAWLAVTWLVGLRQGLLFAVGIGYGAVLAGVSFGFTTGWRVWIRDRDPTGLLAQFLAIALAMVVSIPLIANHAELSGAVAPVAVSVVIGAFVFGLAMQIADGCGSGTLYKAGPRQWLFAGGIARVHPRQLLRRRCTWTVGSRWVRCRPSPCRITWARSAPSRCSWRYSARWPRGCGADAARRRRAGVATRSMSARDCSHCLRC